MHSAPPVPTALVDAAALRAAGRQPPLPFRIALADGETLTLLRLLRVLPGKRVVGEALLGDRRVLAKLFIATGSARHWAQERDGIAALRAAGVPTPAPVQAGVLAGGGHFLATEFLSAAESLAESWARVAGLPAGDARVVDVLAPALVMLGRLHAAGLVQDDLHLGNFLRAGDRLHVIDGDAVHAPGRGRALAAEPAMRNLAVLLAQLPVDWDDCRPPLLAAYAQGGGTPPAADALGSAVAAVRARRADDLLAKSVRDCTLFAVHRDFGRFVAAVRDGAESLAPLLADPDAAMAAGRRLKDGGTCTVATVLAGDRELVVKRYNLKNVRHAASRLWRPSRAWHAWREAHRLRFFGVATPAPLALVEERFGPLRRRAWLVTERCPGPNLLDHLDPGGEPPAAEAAAIGALFRRLHRLRISHGDLKATNLLWHGGRVVLIDLDATVQHRSAAAYARAWRRDRARLLRNWPQDSLLHGWFERVLPPA